MNDVRPSRALTKYVEAARSDLPAPAEVERALSAFLASAPPYQFPSKPVALPLPRTSTWTTTLLLGAALVALFSRSTAPPANVRPSPSPVADVMRSAAPHADATPPPQPSAAVPEAPSAAPKPRRAKAKPRAVAPPATLPVTTRAEAEWQLVEAARSALRRDPARALALAARHAREFPNGTLALERDAITIHALALSGRLSEAQQRLLEFARDHPGSIHVEPLRRMLGRSSDKTPASEHSRP